MNIITQLYVKNKDTFCTVIHYNIVSIMTDKRNNLQHIMISTQCCACCASGVPVVCQWCASGVLVVCQWCASGVLVVC